MKHDDTHNELDFFKNLENDFEQSDAELWAKIEQKIESKPKKTKTVKLFWAKYAIAAMLLLVIGAGGFMKFYTTTITTNKADFAAHTLPDGSIVELNAETTLSYQPYWWQFDRSLQLAGEAFFEVEKGEQFTVYSAEGKTQVLGTSFNIFARKKDYKVFCRTGKVKVSSTKTAFQTNITAGEMAVVDNANKTGEKEKMALNNFMWWKNDKFNFVNENLPNVFAEIARQFDVEIVLENEKIADFEMTASFEKHKNVEETLALVCENFELSFEKTKGNVYQVLKK